jgi:predicted Zn finger-like uncharacterized protein
MLTRCPSCKTTFRVTTAQLKVKLGQVRCGTCQQVFNALDALVDALPEQNRVATSPLVSIPPVPPAVAVPPNAPPGSASELSFHSLLSKEDPPAFTVSRKSPEPSTSSAPQDDKEPEKAETLGLDFDRTVSPLPPPRRRAWPWALASGLAIMALSIQMAIHYRVEIAVLTPETKPALEILCEFAQCTVDLPSKAELVGIEASDLHPINPSIPNRLELTATLRNRAPFAQTWPHLELTITDTADGAVARRVLAPAEYLPAKTKQRDLADGFASQSDSAISVQLATDGLPASGYRIYLFYP